MLFNFILLALLSLIFTQVKSETDDFPCPALLPIHPTTVLNSQNSCRRVVDEQVSRKRVVKRQVGRTTQAGCGSSQLGGIIEQVLGPLLYRNQMRLGDTAQVLQKAIHAATGQAHEVFMGKGDMVINSHQMSGSSQCRMRVGEYYVAAYETPVAAGEAPYNVNDVAQEQFLSNIDFGESLGGSGYPGQVPFPYQPFSLQPFPPQPPIDALLGGILGGLNGINGLDGQPLVFPGGGAGAACFSGDLIVETLKGPKQMRELKMGDEVLSIDEATVSFSPIVMFLHRDEDLRAEFNVITTVIGDSVKLTNEHLIYVSDCDDPVSPLRLVRAKDVSTEDCLMSVRSPEGMLLRQSHQHKQAGIYAPLTLTGEIIINNVLSSCHTNLALKSLQQSIFSLYRYLDFVIPKNGALPLGIEYLIRVLDLFIPTNAVFS